MSGCDARAFLVSRGSLCTRLSDAQRSGAPAREHPGHEASPFPGWIMVCSSALYIEVRHWNLGIAAWGTNTQVSLPKFLTALAFTMARPSARPSETGLHAT